MFTKRPFSQEWSKQSVSNLNQIVNKSFEAIIKVKLRGYSRYDDYLEVFGCANRLRKHLEKKYLQIKDRPDIELK